MNSNLDRLAAFVGAVLGVALCIMLTCSALHKLDQTRQDMQHRIQLEQAGRY